MEPWALPSLWTRFYERSRRLLHMQLRIIALTQMTATPTMRCTELLRLSLWLLSPQSFRPPRTRDGLIIRIKANYRTRFGKWESRA